jgi:uncharacterized membrane protein YgdD (TMEM256/DUF423 family)
LAGIFGASAVALGAYGAHGRFTVIKELPAFDVTNNAMLFLYISTICNLFLPKLLIFFPQQYIRKKAERS